MSMPVVFPGGRSAAGRSSLCTCLLAALFFVLTGSLAFPSLSLAASATEIKKNIAQEKQRASTRKKALVTLSAKERSLYHDLAAIEDRVVVLERRVTAEKKTIDGLAKQEGALRREYEASGATRDRLRREADALLGTFWPVFLEKQAGKHFDTGDSWARAEREATWLSVLYAETGEKLMAVQEAGEQTRQALDHLQKTRAEREEKIRKLSDLQDDLLQQKLVFLKDVQKLRSRKLDMQEQLKVIASTISGLHYKLKILGTHSFPKLKGYLPWPARGRVVKGFRPRAQPPRRGISLALPAHHEVAAVSWGKVVHDGQLRGFGRVIIVYHGTNYYSLYAFLASSRVQLGQKVEKGEILGECGYYPLIGASGLYFELRFHQKAINPLQWLQPVG